MGRRERREMERLTGGRRPDDLPDVSRSWFLRYPEHEGRLTWSDLLPFGVARPRDPMARLHGLSAGRKLTGRSSEE
ncbi:MAG: hypothetical protein FJW86_05450 [Actinobacteria bacterium]|nr:hypothetical protein [Actinomycetota bacterium]